MAMRFLLLWSLMILPMTAQSEETSFQAAYDFLKPWEGSRSDGVNPSTLTGKVMAGYQGWFTCPRDGSNLEWQHYRGRNRKFEPGNCSIDLWPDVSELSPGERYATSFVHADGRTAEVFSSHNRDTVVRHFQWMEEYGIDGVFFQRFASHTKGGKRNYDGLRHSNTVLQHVREGANRHGRTWALMYDLSGIADADVDRVMRDWKELRTSFDLGNDPSYLRHEGKPAVAVWGIGFKDRPITLETQAKLLRFLRDNPEWGGFTVMVGVPTGWRTLNRDSVDDPELHEVLKIADIISPWTVGRYRTPEEVTRHAEENWRPDQEHCEAQKQDYLPVVYPGFSWRNLAQMDKAASRNPDAHIPRLKGQFLWKQFLEAKGAGAEMIYVAMFDEIDEGTAIFKVTNDPPIGESPFRDYEGMPTDHYLWLTGEGARLLREELPLRVKP